MRWIIFILTVLGLAAEASADPPATQPATFALHGRVTIAAGLQMDQPDLSRVVIYLASNPALDGVAPKPEHATIAQQNKAFIPSFLIIPKGTEVEFPNWDHFSHNVFTRSAAAPPFDLDRYPYGQSKSRKFDQTGVVQLFCNIHPFMKATLFVTPNVFFARADANGQFKIEAIPAGAYEVVAWQERCQEQRQSIVLGAPRGAEISFSLAENRSSILANDPPRHGDSYGVERGLGIKREPLNLPVVQDAHPSPTSQPCEFCP